MEKTYPPCDCFVVSDDQPIIISILIICSSYILKDLQILYDN